jgi:cytochrome b561
MHIIRIAWGYLREHQPLLIRIFHIVILCLVLSQIIVSNIMGFAKTGEVSKNIVIYYGTWIHIITGISLFPVTFLFVFIELKRQGSKYFFPYLYGDFSQLKNDLWSLIRFKLPEPSAYGLATIVQGLGLGALALVVCSGLIWYLTWTYMAPWAHTLKEVHESLTGLIEAYVIGHGGMGLLHIFCWWKNQKGR